MQTTVLAPRPPAPCDTARRLRRVLPRLVVAAVFAAPAALAQAPPAFVPVTDEMLQAPAPDDWLMWRRTLDGWGFRSRCLITS